MDKYIARYFIKTTKIIEKFLPDSIVTIQFFQRKDNAILCGINEVLKLLDDMTDTKKYSIKYLKEGTIINNKEVVLELKGNYSEFGKYEGIIDGILARQTSLASNAKKIVNAANGKEVIFMGDRADSYINQANDGYAVSIGGIKTQVTLAQVEKHNGKAIGTVPHALIQMFKGDLVKALEAYERTFPNEKLVALVDFNNDVIRDSIKAYNRFKNKLVAVRVDTSMDVSDAMFKNNSEYGVTPNMIKNLRNALDSAGARDVKIIASSGFDEEKIKYFEKNSSPVDIYGVGGSIFNLNNSFSADAVKINNKKIAKVGRHFQENYRLISYK